jgi:hypothetical protein
MNARRLRATGAVASLVLLNACTLIYVTGDSNSIADSDNHSGSLTLPEAKSKQAGRLPKREEPYKRPTLERSARSQTLTRERDI